MQRHDENREDVPIGMPLRGSSARVLNERLVPVWEGEPGELYLCGPMIARGYADRPALTAERFVADPHGEPGARMYRTGDLAAWTGGRLVHRGRADEQLKIRGFRVEPGELTRVLERLPSVREAVAFGVPLGEEQVLAAAVAGAATRDQIERAVRKSLPDYFIPARLVRVMALPRNATGKIDLAALRELAARLPGAAAHVVTPQGDGEEAARDISQTVLRAMSEVLGRPVAMDEDFFAAGGHSLSGLRLVGLLSAAGVQTSLREVFAAPTPRQLSKQFSLRAENVREGLPDIEDGGALTLQPDDTLSPAEERMLLLHRLGEDDAYRISVRWSLEFALGSELDEAGLQRACLSLLERHAALRRSYPLRGERHIPREYPAEKADLWVGTAPDAASATALADRQSSEMLAKPFNLQAEPPVRIRTVLHPGGVELALLVHHVVTDEHGLGLLAEEFLRICDARARGVELQLPAPALESRVFAQLQNERRREREAGEVETWCRVLAGHAGAGELPADADGTQQGVGTVVRRLEPSQRIGAAAARLGATPFMLAHAAVALVLFRARAGDDLVLASAIAARETPAELTVVDCATNTVAIRHRCIGEGSVRELVERSREAVLDALERGSASFDTVARAVGGPALTDVFVSFFDAASTGFEHGTTRLCSRILPLSAAKAPLSFALLDGGRELSVLLEYDRARFTPLRAAALADAVTAVLRCLLDPAAEHRPLGDIPLVSQAEQERLLGSWAGEEHDVPLRTFAEHFLDCAGRMPESPALTAQLTGEPGASLVTLDYASLAERALRIAVLLRDLGVRAGDTVAVASDRSIELVISHIAVLLSGGVFLALDPLAPAERVNGLLHRLSPRLVLTHGCSLAGGPRKALKLDAPETQKRLIELGPERLEELREQLLREVSGEERARRLEALAYMILTSGSTGTPKAIGVQQRGVSKLIATQRARLGSAAGRRILYFASPVFDAAFWQLCGTLCDGGELVVMPDDARLPGPGFIDFVRAERIDALSVPPSVLAALPEQPELPEGVQLIVGAERLPRPLVRRWARRHRLVNAYGPSEATVNTTLHECDVEEAGPVPIGRPDPGSRCYVVDSAGQLCPVGFPGELLIGGEGVAVGYVGDEERTARVFVPDPFAQSGRCYCSGDLVAWRGDGELHFIGRIDEQLKIRGFRVEPGEIEASLLEVPGVHQAAVAARAGSNGDRLVAYVVVGAAAKLDEATLRAACRARLAAHLVPDRVVLLETIPRLPSGKLDRRALPDPPDRSGEAGPATPLERSIGEAFAAVLELPAPVGPEEDFFELGGTSLVAARLLQRIQPMLRKAAGGEASAFSVTFADLLAAPTPRGIAGLFTSGSPRPDDAAVFPTDPLGPELLLRRGLGEAAPVWFLPPLAGMGWGYSGLRRYIDPARDLIALQARNLAGLQPAPLFYAEVVTDWAELIQARAGEHPVHLVGWSFGGAVAHGVACELQRRGFNIGLIAMLDAYPRAQWADVPPTRAQTLRSALGMLGVEASLEETGQMSDQEAARRMAAANPLLSGLAAFDPSCMLENFHAGPELERTARYERLSGSILFFEATRTSHLLAAGWQEWQAYADEVKHVPVDVSHQRMLSPQALETIGPRLDEALRWVP